MTMMVWRGEKSDGLAATHIYLLECERENEINESVNNMTRKRGLARGQRGFM